MGPEGLELSWNWLMPCDAVLVQRPWLPMHVQVMVQAHMMGLPVWIDWDDDYAAVHPSNPSYRVFANCGEMLDRATVVADIISVSTDEIGRRRCERTKTMSKVRVIPNAAQFPGCDLNKPRMRRVCWRGGASHEFDLLNFLPVLVEIAKDKQFSYWDWCFLGDVPWQVLELMPRDRLVSDFGAEPYLYMEAMNKLMPWVHIVPLANTPFNPAKSNLAWIEASLAGAIVLAPDWQEWRRPGIANYQDKADFKEKLQAILKCYVSNKGAHPSAQFSQRWILENLSLSKVNEQRWDILNQLANVNAPRFFSKTV